jgi:Domain of unknown function (DUF1707)
MTWLEILEKELGARGVPRRERERIVLELRDHIDCDPGCEDRLGDPGALAATFGDELASSKSRRAALDVFAALAATAVALVVSQATLGRIGYPGFDRGLTQALFWPALLGMFVAPQAALVSGTLAALRAVRRRRAIALPAAELALISRRARIALAAGFSTVAGMELYVVNFSQRLPAWWLVLAGGLGVAAGAALARARHVLAAARQLRSSAAGPAGSIYDDLPMLHWRWLRARPWRLGIVGSLFAAMLMTAFEARAEHSLLEGVQRGVVEGLAAAAGFALLGRAVGLTAPRAPGGARLSPAAPALGFGPGSRRVGDDDRRYAEAIVRDGFARGQISLDELGERVAAIHAARTLTELRDQLADLL